MIQKLIIMRHFISFVFRCHVTVIIQIQNHIKRAKRRNIREVGPGQGQEHQGRRGQGQGPDLKIEGEREAVPEIAVETGVEAGIEELEAEAEIKEVEVEIEDIKEVEVGAGQDTEVEAETREGVEVEVTERDQYLQVLRNARTQEILLILNLVRTQVCLIT